MIASSQVHRKQDLTIQLDVGISWSVAGFMGIKSMYYMVILVVITQSNKKNYVTSSDAASDLQYHA